MKNPDVLNLIKDIDHFHRESILLNHSQKSVFLNLFSKDLYEILPGASIGLTGSFLLCLLLPKFRKFGDVDMIALLPNVNDFKFYPQFKEDYENHSSLPKCISWKGAISGKIVSMKIIDQANLDLFVQNFINLRKTKLFVIRNSPLQKKIDFFNGPRTKKFPYFYKTTFLKQNELWKWDPPVYSGNEPLLSDIISFFSFVGNLDKGPLFDSLVSFKLLFSNMFSNLSANELFQTYHYMCNKIYGHYGFNIQEIWEGTPKGK